MNFVEAIKSGFSNYVNFSGRAQRSAYWWWALFEVIVLIVAQLIDVAIGAPVVYAISALALLLPTLAVGVRRLHDTDRTGWWLLIGLVPLVGLIVLIIFFVQKGTTGPNQYGPDPL
jgi:uncharacterized membrane protein YhaH (DUF805 family)